MKSLAHIVGLLGLWLVVSALVFSLPAAALVSNVIGGLLIALIAAYSVGWQTPRSLDYIAGLLGLWLAVSALVFSLPQAAVVSNVLSGLLVTFIVGIEVART